MHECFIYFIICESMFVRFCFFILIICLIRVFFFVNMPYCLFPVVVNEICCVGLYFFL